MTLTIQKVIDTILQYIPGAPFNETVDTFKSGDPSQEVTGIVTTFLASQAVIQKAIALGANLIITHEPTYYNHLDNVDWLKDNPVFEAKRKLLADHHIVVWRFHDSWHSHQPDGINTGVFKTLGWDNLNSTGEWVPVIELPSTSVRNLVNELKSKLGIATLRLVGSPEMNCQKVAFMAGACGGAAEITFLGQNPVDVLICGEGGGEWETCEYVRDANTQGRNLALIVLGHAHSEEPGMAWLVEWLRQRLPGVPISHLPVGDPFLFL